MDIKYQIELIEHVTEQLQHVLNDDGDAEIIEYHVKSIVKNYFMHIYKNKMAKEAMFPDISFEDKVAVYFKDGTQRVFKHLYHDTTDLDAIDWNMVVDCHEV